ncbi:hypothetical protein [Amycolatopsis sp. GM8]|uniref:hypothetical protein n=1 Tax=Amycolatopsis sp. GM8 TaxID=2896530 RepID=UPI001F349FA0|nr:hypothetical protein [Amycolatopsis sp. GM8]
MSTPEHQPTNTPGTGPTGHNGHTEPSTDVEARQAAEVTLYGRVVNPTRTTRTVSWLGWHALELSGVLAPVGFAATVSPWFSLVSVLVAAGWAANEMRQHHQQSRGTAVAEESTEDGKADA